MWEMTSFLLECLHFPTLAHVSATVKRVIVLQGLISVRADSRLRFIIAAKKMCGTIVGCLSRVITSVYVLVQVLMRTVGQFDFTMPCAYDVRSDGNLSDCHRMQLLLLCDIQTGTR